MLDRDKIVEFSRHWINTWNAGDIAEIMSHYAKDVEFSSPLVIQRLNRTSGKLAGADELRKYFELSLHSGIQPRFSVESVAIGSDAFVINYNNHRGQGISEVFYPNADMVVRKVSVCWRWAGGHG